MAIKFEPTKAIYYADRGKCFKEMGRLEEALEDLNRAIDYKNDESAFYYNRGLTYQKMNLYKKAVDDFTRVIDITREKGDANKTELFNALYNRGN